MSKEREIRVLSGWSMLFVELLLLSSGESEVHPIVNAGTLYT